MHLLQLVSLALLQHAAALQLTTSQHRRIAPLAASEWGSFNNYCVDKNGNDLPQTFWTAGTANQDKCKQECLKKLLLNLLKLKLYLFLLSMKK